MLEPVKRISSPTVEEFQHYITKQIPVVVSGAVSNWKAMSKWQDPAYFKQTVGSMVLPVRFPSGSAGYLEQTQKEMPVSDFVDLIGKGTSCYLADLSLNRTPALCADIDELPFPFLESFDREYIGHNRVWFFGRDTFTPTHFHFLNQAILCQVVGRKRMLLFPPSQSRYLYASFWSKNSPVHPDRPDFTKHPKFKYASPLECWVEPGDIAFIPVHWWHFVESPDLTIAVTLTYPAPWRQWHFPQPGITTFLLQAALRLRGGFRRPRAQ